MSVIKLATVLLVDERGWVLLQERDAQAPTGADQWSMPGGHVEPGEEFEPAAYREILEETGLVPPHGALTLWREETLTVRGQQLHFAVYAGITDAVDADIVLGEGRQIVFVDPDQIPDLDLTVTGRHFLIPFLASAEYASLRDARRSDFASVALIDPQGRILLQERDSRPAIDPDCWGFVGGHVEPGERVLAAAYRELVEETGIRLSEGLTEFGRFTHFHADTAEFHTITLFTAPTELTDADIVLGEGRQIVFVDPTVIPGLPQTVGARHAMPYLLDRLEGR